MQFNAASKTAAVTAFNNLHADAKAKIMASTVRLKNGAFTGSGVLVEDSEGIVGIITAKHNLTTRAGIDTPANWNQTQVNDLVAGFLENLNVGYGPWNPTPLTDRNSPMPTNTQVLTSANSDIEFRGGSGSWDYDLMFISFKADLPLRTYARQAANHIKYAVTDQGFYRGNLVNSEVFVVGFGNPLDQTGAAGAAITNPFQVRNSQITAAAADVRRQNAPVAVFNAVVTLAASANSSTSPGDSGGPVFYVQMARGVPTVYLIGVNLGANYDPGRLLPDNPIVNNAVNFLYYGGTLF